MDVHKVLGDPSGNRADDDGSDEWYLSSNFCEGCAHVMRSLVKEPAAHIPEFPIPRMPDKYERSQLRFNFSIHRL
jgi:hypothetical protein